MGLADNRKKAQQTNESVVNETNMNTGAAMAQDAEPVVDLDFDISGGLFSSLDSGSEYTNKYAENVKALLQPIEAKGVKIAHRVFKLDNSVYTNLPYSYVVVATESNKAKKVYYHVVCLEATGRKPLSVSQVMEGVKSNQPQLLYVAADTFDPVLKQVVEKVLTSAYNVDASALITSEGHIVPFDADPEQIAKPSAVIAKNANIGKLALDQSLIKFISIPERVSKNRNIMFQLDITYNTGVTVGILGRPIRSDFELDLNEVVINKTSNMMFNREIKNKWVSGVGYVEYLPEERPGMQPGLGVQRDIIPMIILDNVITERTTPELAMLNIINSAVFSNPNNLFALLMHVPRDLGVLNYLANIDGEKIGFGKLLSFKSGKMTDAEVLEKMSRMFRPNPTVAVEIEFYGDDFGITHPLAALGVPGAAQQANEYLIEVTEALLGSKIMNRQIAYGEPIIVPVGEFIDKDGNKRDIREFDLAYVIQNAKDPTLIMKWVASNAPASVTGMDPYIAKLEVINALAPNALVTGKAIRLVINPLFVKEVAEKAVAAGYNPKTDIGYVNVTTFNNLQAIAAAYGNATLSGVNFGAYTQQQQFTMPGISMFGGFGYRG
jgi:hypothetical protein